MARVSHPAPDAAYWEQEFQALLQNLPDAVFVQELDGRLTSVNAAAERISGFSRQELFAMELHQLLVLRSSAQIAELFQPGVEPSWRDAEIVNASGVRTPVELRATVDRTRGRCYLIARERNERDYGGEVARQSESRFRLMAKNLTEAVLAYDMDRRLIFANPAVQNLTGYSPEELASAQFICWIHPDDRERMLSHWDTLFAGEAFYEEEYRLITKDGRMKWATASWGPIIDDLGEQVGVQGREHDVTERKLAEETWHQTEQRLRIDEQRYRALFENSPFPMWEEDFSAVKEYLDLLSRSGIHDLRDHLNTNREAVEECLRRVKVIDVNRAAREFYGSADKQQLLDGLAGMFDEHAFETFRDEITTLAETNSVFKTELEARTLTGEPRSVSMIVTLTGSPNLDWSRVIVSFFDITDRKHMEEQMLQSQKLESLGRLAGGVAHDFNNLLTVINGYSDHVLKMFDPQDETGQCIAAIKSAGERGAELTRQLLAFSRKQVAQPRPMDLNALILQSHELLQRILGADVTLTLSLDPQLGVVKADQGQLHQVLMNLVMNAREAMPEGGGVTIETSNIFLGAGLREQAESATGRPFVRFAVSDTGMGIDEPTRKRLFEPFFTTKSIRKGTGLGLATVFGIVSQSGGQIAVASESGKGAAFKIYLPRTDSPVSRVAVRHEVTESFRGSGTVLVVEDQEEVRRLTCILLRELGFEILAAADASEALKIMEQHGPHIQILLTDLIMPGMNGRELAERLLRVYPLLRVVFMSGYTDQTWGENAEMDDSIAFLSKPFTHAKLIEVLRKIAN